jgi:hypothetical protein
MKNGLSIHNPVVRALIAVLVFIAVTVPAMSHFMDAEPPYYVEVIYTPLIAMLTVFRFFVPYHNIGTQEHPIYEATPIDLLFGLFFLTVSLLSYAFVTYFFLVLISRLLRRHRLD